MQNLTSNKVIYLEPNIEVILKPSIRAKRVIIRIKGDKAILVVPRRVPLNQAMEFLKSKSDWIKANLTKQQKISFEHLSTIKIFGKNYVITHSHEKARGIKLEGDNLMIYGKNTNFDIKIKKFLALLLQNKLTALVNQMSQKLCVKYNKIQIKEMDSRWGSCNIKGDLAFNFKLVFTDINIVEYVVAHEVSHLLEMNHGKNFWGHVEELYPNWQLARKWLKNHGHFIV
jgi:predicted metal-dependent hydrolase